MLSKLAVPRWIRTTSGTSGPRRAQAVTTGTNKPQVVVPSRPGPRPLKQGGSGLRIPPDGCRGPTALANEAGVTEDGPHPPAELAPSLPAPSHVHPHRPCPGRALSIGQQRSFTDNNGQCVSPPSCWIPPYAAIQRCFPSSRFSKARIDLAVPARPIRSLAIFGRRF